MNKKIKLVWTVAIALLFSACTNNNNETTTATEAKPTLVDEVLTAEKQRALTPEQVIENLKKGNERFMKNDLTQRNHSAQVRKTTKGQFPEAVVLSCIDSRVPVEDVFDKGIGDVFVARVAGNFENVDILGSLEYSCKVAGSKVVMVLGHEHCGAVKAAVDDVKLGNITEMLSKIRPTITAIEYEGDRTSKNKEFVQMACESNVKNTIKQIRAKSPILKEMEDKGEIKIVGAVYDLDDGKVSFVAE